MKNMFLLLLLAIPGLGLAQKNTSVEFQIGGNFTDYTNKIISTNGKLGYDFGFNLLKPLKNSNTKFLLGLRFMDYGQFRKQTLRWGIQNNGGVFDPSIDSGENITDIKYVNNYFYLEMPFGLRHYMGGDKAKFFIQGEIMPSYFIANQDRTIYKAKDGPDESLLQNVGYSDVRTVNVGAGFSLGLELPIGHNFSLSFQPHASLNFLGIQNSNNESKWYALGVRGGVVYDIK